MSTLQLTPTEQPSTDGKDAILPFPASCKPDILPACARIGNLDEAREMVRAKQWPDAWSAALAAISVRPYHPEAYLLLAEIARGAGDGSSARRCAKTAREMAPKWAAPKRFLKGAVQDVSKPEWLKLPSALWDKPAEAPRISVCLIARNEERWLAQCLRSVRALASQIIVVDTGSTDRTTEIAREMGAEVHFFQWSDDFSASRNASLEHATGDWVLCIDADEELMPGEAAVLYSEIRDPSVMGYRLRMFNIGHEKLGYGFVPRLFRNAPGIHFIGRIHEQAFTSVQERCQQWGLKNELGKTALLHHGYTDEITANRNKIARNLRLLERGIEERPGDPNLIMNLGVELVRSGKLEAGIERYWEAFRIASGRPVADTPPEWREALLTQLATHLMAAKRFSDIVQLWRNPFANSGGLTAAQHFSLAVALMRLKQPAEAVQQIRQCLAKRDLPSFTPIPPEVHKAGPHHCLALCLIALDDNAAAQQAFDAALAAEPSSRAARYDLARFQAGQGRTGEALKVLQQLAAENPAEARVWEAGGLVALSRPDHLEFAKHWTSEAVKHFPENPALLSQRAEALLLAQDVAQSLSFWRRAQPPASNRRRAAMVVCEVLTGDRQHHFTAAEEPAISAEVAQWYRQCIHMGAHGLIRQLHERMEAVRLSLPTFARILEAAHRQALAGNSKLQTPAC